MPHFLPGGVLLSCLCLLSLPSQAMSRLYDGEAEVWSTDQALCFGARTFKSAGLFLNRTLRVDRQRVVIHGVEVNGAGPALYWSMSADEPEDGLPINSSTCIAYGQQPGGFASRQRAAPLADGLYSVMLYGSDRKSGNRARFYKQFCVQRSGDRMAVADAYYDEGLWRCPQ